ncbi:hypothetical protein M885DRAFT_614269 [Pelagophyceae sp. CCMP2097]|nr:hypothetical protein M885DRAFT_614269 [Pelagophyceae sp. CCMP2097]
MARLATLAVAVLSACGATLARRHSRRDSGDVAVCPGEGPRYGDFKCHHDSTHRVCAKLLDDAGAPLSWGPKGSFWQITSQTRWQWDESIRSAPNAGDSWCICMWATASLVAQVGCANVHIHCDSTDIDYVLKQYHDGGVDLEPAHKCLQEKCGPRNADHSL